MHTNCNEEGLVRRISELEAENFELKSQLLSYTNRPNTLRHIQVSLPGLKKAPKPNLVAYLRAAIFPICYSVVRKMYKLIYKPLK
jgi:hypothetical protein